jgi:hypothetical protein
VTLRSRALAIAAAAACTLVCASAATAESYRYRIVPADRTAARQAVITLDDLGRTGWTGGAQKPDRTDSTECAKGRSPLGNLVVTGDAESRYTYQGGGVSIFTSAQVFKTVGMLRAAWRHEVGQTDLDCARRVMAEDVSKVGRLVSFDRLAFPKTGSHTMAFRAVVRYKNGASALTDMIAFARGRTVCLLVMGGLVDTPDAPALLLAAEQRLASILLSRMTVA